MAQAELRSAQSGVQMGRAKVSLHKGQASRYRLSAPFAGTLVACDVDPGDSVAAGQVLAKVISDDRQVRFAFPPDQTPEKDEFPVVVRDTVSGRSMFTTVHSVKPEVDTSAQLVFATAVLNLTEAERKAWLPGTRVEVTPADADVQNNERFHAPTPEPQLAPKTPRKRGK
jgi:multidrug efflux pump subunit AcrA (membrane-fusion protein)